MAGLGKHVGTEFTLVARMNGQATFNGQDFTVWYFTNQVGSQGFMGDRFLPSEHIELIEGELCHVDFTNMSGMDHTIHLHGMDVDQANDGVPQTSFAVPPLGSYIYEFVAPHAGTYHYHCHVDTVVHYQRGMSGTVIVRPPDASIDRAWEGGPTFDEEVLWHLQTLDSTWMSAQQSGPVTARHRPDLFLINGLQTAEALVDPFTQMNLAVGETGYLRLVNNAYQWARVSLGGHTFHVVASDGRPMQTPQRVYAWEIGPGERYDLLIEARSPLEAEARVEYLDDYTGNTLGEVRTRITIV
jgi:FtsP/CotA-like multicopper oxidase with cupredoxin domain